MKLTKILSVIFLPITIILFLLSLVLFSNTFLPDNFLYKLIYDLVKNISIIKTDKTTTLMYVVISACIVLIDIIILILANMSIKDKEQKFLKDKCYGFEYIEDGEQITVIAKYENKKDGYGKGNDEPFNILPTMIQKLFNKGYSRLLHVQMTPDQAEHNGKRYFILAKGQDNLKYHEPIIGLNKRQYPNPNNPNYIDIVYEYYYRGNNMLVVAEDGSRMMCTRSKKRKE